MGVFSPRPPSPPEPESLHFSFAPTLHPSHLSSLVTAALPDSVTISGAPGWIAAVSLLRHPGAQYGGELR
jgi:hypothetical protein